QTHAGINDLLHKLKLTAADVAIGIAVEESRIFRRQFLLPKQARNALASIAEQDLLRKTPFRLEDIHHDHVAERIGDKITISQLVIRRSFVEEAARQCGLEPNEIAFVEAVRNGEEAAALSRLRLWRNERRASWLPRLLFGLLAAAILM